MGEQSWFRRNLPRIVTLLIIAFVTVAVGKVIIDMETEGEFEVKGRIWEIEPDGKIWIAFEGSATLFDYRGDLPSYIEHGEFVSMRCYFGRDNSEILEFKGLAEEPSILDIPIVKTTLVLCGALFVMVLIGKFVVAPLAEESP